MKHVERWYSMQKCDALRKIMDNLEDVLPGNFNKVDRWYILALGHSPAANLWDRSSKDAHDGKQARSIVSALERAKTQCEALISLEKAALTKSKDPKMIFSLGLENVEQQNLTLALDYAKKFLDMMVVSSVKDWRLLALILSTQQRFSICETGKGKQRELLRLKAKLRIAEGQSMRAIETYRLLLACLLYWHATEDVQECTSVLDRVEYALPNGMLEAFRDECKLQETVSKAGLSHEAIAALIRL
eukprot:Gb_38510 [translate_table: standard]